MSKLDTLGPPSLLWHQLGQLAGLTWPTRKAWIKCARSIQTNCGRSVWPYSCSLVFLLNI